MHITSTTLSKHWFGNRNMTSNCDVTNSAHQIQITTIRHFMKPPWKIYAYANGLWNCPDSDSNWFYRILSVSYFLSDYPEYAVSNHFRRANRLKLVTSVPIFWTQVIFWGDNFLDLLYLHHLKKRTPFSHCRFLPAVISCKRDAIFYAPAEE